MLTIFHCWRKAEHKTGIAEFKINTVLLFFPKKIKEINLKKNPWQSVIGSGVCSDPWARRTTQKHTHTQMGGPGRVEHRIGKKKKRREPNQCWMSAYDRWQSRVLLLFSLFLSNSLSFSFCFLLAVSRPLRVLSLTIAWAFANTSRAHLFGNKMPVAQPMR